MARRDDSQELPGAYKEFHQRIIAVLPAERILCGPFTNLALGDDASYYRLVPKIVVKAKTPDEVAMLLRTATELKVPVTFRAAGTSLSGQAVSDSVLIYLSGNWRGLNIHDGARSISLEPGVIGGEANFQLAPFGKKIGPDPASINAAMIGGIAANNASGMCCGTAENSYKTVESMKLVFVDGTTLDTADKASRERFKDSHGGLLAELAALRDEIRADVALAQRIRHKFKIKNTTGYGLNSFVDHDDPFDILLHLMVGSEGTLAFIREVTYRTVVEHPHKASALIIYPSIENACKATMALKSGPVSAVELMDRASLRSVEDKPGMPTFLKGLSPQAAAILVETRAADKAGLMGQIQAVQEVLAGIESVFPCTFVDAREDYEKLWNIRKGLFPSVGGARRLGTSVVIEDVVFPIEHLAEGTVELQKLMQKNGFPEGIIFGHALEGNLHFVFCPDFGSPEMVADYQSLMDAVATMVVGKYDGSLKGEHGTGRNMAPFVEMEWGKQAYGFMVRLKAAFDPENLLNPGVILNDNPRVHLENLKPMPKVSPLVDRCIECGFCESICPSRTLTSTPRQRITLQRHMGQLALEQKVSELQRFREEYDYFGNQTCAADGLCATVCPVSVDTGDFTKAYRHKENTPRAVTIAQWVADHYGLVARAVGRGLKAVDGIHGLLGSGTMDVLVQFLRKLSGGRIPLWTKWMPTGVTPPSFVNTVQGRGRHVVYFPSCVVRTMGSARQDPDQRAVFEATLSLLRKAGFDVLFPARVTELCCGMTFGSKGFFEQAEQKVRELERELRAVSRNGEIPILCDTSPCVYTMRSKIEPDLKMYEPVEFIHDHLLDKLAFTPSPETVTLHVTCSSVKMGLAAKFRTVAQACAKTVVVPHGVGCCGFAGDRGFNYPELNAAALADLRPQVPVEAKAGFSNSRTCEIGLSLHGGIPYQSIVYLVDACTVGK
jgi:D-lactate dehydrogenase